ncbi:MAG: alpha/beta fold hydrolase [Pseudanabaenaceae cyanobacterium]
MTTVVAVENPAGANWEWRGQRVHYVRAGSGPERPPLLEVHGFGASTDHWRQNIADLSQDFEVWAIDLLGFGRSSKPNWDYGGEIWAAQLADFIESHIRRPVVVAGNSLGGYAANALAASRGDLVAGVILLNPAGAFRNSHPLGAPLTPWQEAIRNLVQSLLKQPWASRLLFEFVRQKSQIRKTLLQVYVNKAAVTDRLVEEIYRPSCDPGAAQVFATIFRGKPGKKVDELLADIHCPVLAIWGEADPWMNTPVTSARYREHCRNLTEVRLPAGHCPHDDMPELTNAAIRDWMLTHWG